MSDIFIPEMSKEEMMKRYGHIKPVVTVNGKLYYLREFTLEEINDISYLWDVEKNISHEVGEDEIEVWEGKEFKCLHGYGYYGLFKPSVGEVLSQVNAKDIPIVKAFEIIEKPTTENMLHKDSFESRAFKEGYHVLIVRLYKEKRK